ncbi:hypothetical protein H0A61_01976 [Koleobacter methoxysyntrophicus]|uniref:Small, acid-soluble spore protein, alpha/beta type n=1 Tax=Koleobacter methoxysyntrophicus TaxID=2751313 RepID=A0A8A0RMG6_9FIRM|nr:small, acid-soluble spore protein, alpha/beta type [Koleobacter methoxysyntrophicus]QSQ09601.1 hypothetical protein H0A61_01976 [Koleobacter methoxysyntrophicus]
MTKIRKSQKNKQNKLRDEIEKSKGTLKYEIAEELGLLEKVRKLGWGGLSAEETGRIGGLVAKRKREMRMRGK